MRIIDGRAAGTELRRDLTSVLSALNATEWYGNMIGIRTETVRPRSLDFTLRVEHCNANGAAVSGSGRKSCYACWHLHRDVMEGLLAIRPESTIRTGVQTYQGRIGFGVLFPGTATRNVGSIAAPRPWCRACRCPHGVFGTGPGVDSALLSLVTMRSGGNAA
jgi:hypothetical protein